jgi:methionine synthase / methylenetetrahydrofolate reductase(NADPH)
MSTVPTNSSVKPDNGVDRLFAGVPCLCDGAMGTMLLDRGISLDRCYEELNLSQPETVADIHTKYLQAGAQVIETNTFGANAYRLQHFGLSKQVTQINLAGVHVARQCANQFPDKAWVAGSVGPLGMHLESLGGVSLHVARAAFAQQIRALAEGGPGVGIDLLMIETMTSLAEATEAIRAAQQVAPQLRMVVMMTFNALDRCLDGTSAEEAAARLTALGADAVGCNCSDGPATALRVIKRMRSATHLPLAAMPNAGLPRVEAGLTTYPISPPSLADFVNKAIPAGATFIGGCCGTTPAHIRTMKSVFAAGVSG